MHYKVNELNQVKLTSPRFRDDGKIIPTTLTILFSDGSRQICRPPKGLGFPHANVNEWKGLAMAIAGQRAFVDYSVS